MTLIDIEGGDHLQANLFTTKLWTQVPDNLATGRVRGSAWSFNSHGSAISMAKDLPSSYSSLILGIGINIQASTGSRLPIKLISRGGGTLIAQIQTNSSGVLQITNSGGTVIATGTTILANSAWYYIEVQITVNGASGSCELHLNGVAGEIPLTTGNFGTTNLGRIELDSINGGSMIYDDLYVLDTTGSAPQNSFLGDVCIETLLPRADGTHQAWTPSAGSTHFDKVNENSGTHPDGDTSYVSDINPGDIDTYTVASLAALSGNVYGVMTNLYARKDDAAARQIAPVIREAGTDYVGSTTGGLTTSYLFYRQLYPLDPAGAAWTIASVNAAEYGVKEVT